MSIAQNIQTIRQRMAEAAREAGRDPSEILLVGASKMNGADACKEAVAGGIDALGENRVQELLAKYAEDAYVGAPLHFIGHLQRNKVRQIVGKVDLIQSVDRVELLACIEKEAARQDLIQDILLEINIGAEESKSGFTPEEAKAVAAAMDRYPHCRLRGLMAIPPISEKSGSNCRFFEEIQRIAVDITTKNPHNSSMEVLSMGMTDDFEDAIACGSTMIRVGTAIFGARHYQ